MIKKNLLSFFTCFLLLETNINADETDNNEYVKKQQIKLKLQNMFDDINTNQIVVDKDLQYIKPDPIKRRKPNQFLVWTRAEAISINNGEYIVVKPEGYSYVYETTSEIYIANEPTGEEESLLIK